MLRDVKKRVRSCYESAKALVKKAKETVQKSMNDPTIEMNTLLHPDAEVKLRSMIKDLSRKEVSSIMTQSPIMSPTIDFEEYCVLFAKYLPMHYSVPEPYHSEDRPFKDNHDWLKQHDDNVEAIGHISMGSRFVRDGILGVDLSSSEARMPGCSLHPITSQMEPPSLSIATSEHLKELLEAKYIRRLSATRKEEDSLEARKFNEKQREHIISGASDLMGLNRTQKKIRDVKKSEAQMIRALSTIPDVDRLSVTEADFRLRYAAQKIVRAEHELDNIQDLIATSDMNYFDAVANGSINYRWYEDSPIVGADINEFGYSTPNTGYYLKTKPGVLADAEVYQAGLCPPDLRDPPDAPLPLPHNYFEERKQRMDEELEALEAETKEVIEAQKAIGREKRNAILQEVVKAEEEEEARLVHKLIELQHNAKNKETSPLTRAMSRKMTLMESAESDIWSSDRSSTSLSLESSTVLSDTYSSTQTSSS